MALVGEHIMHVITGPQTEFIQREFERGGAGAAESGADNVQGHEGLLPNEGGG